MTSRIVLTRHAQEFRDSLKPHKLLNSQKRSHKSKQLKSIKQQKQHEYDMFMQTLVNSKPKVV